MKTIDERLSKWEKINKRKVKHHIVNRCDGGSNKKDNLLKVKEGREKAFHFLFGNLTLKEAGKLLLRVARAKKAQK